MSIETAIAGLRGALSYTEAPTPYNGRGPSVFLAGGITGCPDWQAVARAALARCTC